ncbi:MAG: outer-membrane lipoprotein carrier protein LolA [Paludibacteraceae bacterium]|nr:outer-membrane lipoprotein carrier protein LolA [Paludibacteraceae bacterium]
MKRQIFIVISFLISVLSFAQETAVDPKAKALLDKAIVAFETKKGLSADFVIKVENSRNEKSENFQGNVLLKGEKFKLSLADVDTYFDGKTQYVLMKKENEVTISNPEKEDMKEINPILLMKSCKTDYKMRYLGEEKVGNKIMEKVELYPNDLNSKYSIITLLMTKDELQLNTIILKGKNGIITHFQLSKIEYKKDLADSLFVFNVAKNPNVEVVDLR